MGWLFVASVLLSYLFRKSFVTVFHYSNNRLVASALCLNNSHPNGLSVIQYRFNQPIVLFYDLVPLSLLTGNPPFPYYINNQYLYSWCLSALSRCTAQRRPLAGLRPRPQTEVLLLASDAAIWSCVTRWSMCTQIWGNITWLSRSSSAVQLTD